MVFTSSIDSAVIDGFYIVNGYAGNASPGADLNGGGWYNAGSGNGNTSHPTIRNVIISGNHADMFGGGLYNEFEYLP